MNPESVNRWLTLAANIGVLIGIILLLVEMEQNRQLTRAQIHEVRADAWVANRFARADSEFVLPALEKLYAAGYPDDLQALEELSPVEVRRMSDLFEGFAGDYDNLIYQYQQGYLDEEYYAKRIETSIREMAPWWQLFGVGGNMPYLQSVIEKMGAAAE